MTTVDPRRPTGADEGRSIARNMAHGIRYMAQATRGARSRHRQAAVSRRLRHARRSGRGRLRRPPGGHSRFPCARVVRRPPAGKLFEIPGFAPARRLASAPPPPGAAP